MSSEIFNPYLVMQGAFIPNLILENDELDPLTKLFWGRMAQCSESQHHDYATVFDMGKSVGLSTGNVTDALNELIDAGFLGVASKTVKRNSILHPDTKFIMLPGDDFYLNEGRVGGRDE